MSAECERCGTPTDSDSLVVDGSVFRLCDGCRDDFEKLLEGWLSRERKPAVRGGCSTCGGPVEARFRYLGHGVEVVVNCPTCGWTERVDE
ncbi:ORF 39 [Haloarcula hispanica virus SH1]|uniref:ORF 39 n=1 Tax=Haloarcula hispanica SH1 virus TaxID=326574 RepID=Q4KPE8_9VIRU|nr:ORF 39 [Haloarcula hispanica virus SH1]AAY24965.1 ORF 39 [Haloarcula hispanica virus SH1]